MKKLLTLLTITIFTISVSCQSTTSENKEASKAPVIKFESVEHDYGTMEKGANGDCEFEFTNEGEEPLILSDVRSSCGCTIPSWPQQPIKKGEKAKIKVHYDTQRIGSFGKSITVNSNASNTPVVLKIKGVVEDKTATTSQE